MSQPELIRICSKTLLAEGYTDDRTYPVGYCSCCKAKKDLSET